MADEDTEIAYESKFNCPKTVMILCVVYGLVLGLYYSILVSKPLYVTDDLHMSRDEGMFLSHFPIGVRLMGGIIGAVLADSYFGKFNVMALSYILIVLIPAPLITASTWYTFSTSTRQKIFLIGVCADLLVGFGSVVHPAFIAEQFRMPEQERTLQAYYTFDYLYYNICVAVLEFVTVEYTYEFSCLGGRRCYQLIFLSYYITYAIATILFLSMKKFYIIRMPERSVIKDAVVCTFVALRNKRRSKGENISKHWLDWADCFDQQWRDDLKQVCKILTMLFPYFIYYFLYAQINSMWIYQASRLDGRLSENWTMKPEQIDVVNPIIIVIFAPFSEFVLNTFFEKIKFLRTALQKVGLAYVLTMVSFLMASILQVYIDKNSSPRFQQGRTQLRIFNMQDYTAEFDSQWTGPQQLGPHEVAQFLDLEASGKISTEMRLLHLPTPWSGNITAEESKGVNYVITDQGMIRLDKTFDNTLITPLGFSAYFLCASACADRFQIKFNKESTFHDINLSDQNEDLISVPTVGLAEFYINSKQVSMISLEGGGLYSIIIASKEGVPDISKYSLHTHVLIEPNVINIAWIFPQYVTITIAEIFLYVSINMFVYTQAPPSLRSVVRGLFMSGNSLAQMTLGLVSLISVAEVIWFFSLTVALGLGTVLHIIMAYRYKYQMAHD